MPLNINPKQKKTVLGGAAVLALLLVNFGIILRWELNSLKTISQNLGKAKTNLSQYTKYSTNSKNLQADIDGLRSKYAGLQDLVFTEPDLPLLLDEIARKANSLAIKIMQIRPEGIEEKGKGKDKDAAASSGFQPLAIKLELICGFHQLGALLGQIESNPLLALDGMRISRGLADTTRQKAEITLRAYVNKK